MSARWPWWGPNGDRAVVGKVSTWLQVGEPAGASVFEVMGFAVVGDTVGDIVGQDVVGDVVGEVVGSEVVGAEVGDTVHWFIGVWQQESGKGPRLANGAAKLRA